MSRSVRDPDYRTSTAAKPTEPVPLEYCDGGVCWRLADRWEYAARYGEWLAVCDDHGDRIKAHNQSSTASKETPCVSVPKNPKSTK